MAYSFNGSTQSLEASSAPTNNDTMTMACLFNTGEATANMAIMGVTDKDTNNDEYYLNTNAGALRTVVKRTSSLTDTGGSYSTNTWHHAAGTFQFAGGSSTTTEAFLDGASAASSTSAIRATVANFDSAMIGALNRPTDVIFYNGLAAEAAIWDLVLTNPEIAWLAAGYSPLTLTHRLGNLVFYKDLIRELNRPYIGPSLTNNNGATVVAHPRIIYPSVPIIGIPTAAAPPAAASLLLMQQSFRA